MKTNSPFNLKRFLFLLRNEMIMSYKSILTAAAGIAGVILFINIIAGFQLSGTDIPDEFYFAILFVGGFFLTSRTFQDIHDPQKGLVYYMIPTSLFEKLSAKIFVSGIIYPLVLPFYFLAITGIAYIYNSLVYHCQIDLFNPLNIIVWRAGFHYFLIQSLFLFASVYFKKHALMKLVISAFVINMALSFAGMVFTRILFHDFFNNHLAFFAHQNWQFIENLPIDFQNFIDSLVKISKFAYYFLLAPFFWGLSYLRLRETEV